MGFRNGNGKSRHDGKDRDGSRAAHGKPRPHEVDQDGNKEIVSSCQGDDFLCKQGNRPVHSKNAEKKGDAHELDEKVRIEAFQDGRIVHARKAPQDEGKKKGYETDIGLAEKTEDDRQKKQYKGNDT